jgi:ubiquinone/menaquinone biosynthesis C-methylase UbiE
LPEVANPGREGRVAATVDEQRDFWSQVARRYDEVVDLQIGPRTRSLVRDRLAREPRLGRVVELGCGTGFYTQELARNAEHVVATDLSPGMLEVAAARVAADNVTFRAEDCERTSLGERAFDTAFMSLVIHFTEPRRALAEVRRLVRPGGTLLIANLDPGALGRLDRLRGWLRIFWHGIAGYRRKPPSGFGKNLLTVVDLRERLHAAGFEVVATETISDGSRSSNIPVEYVRARRI